MTTRLFKWRLRRLALVIAAGLVAVGLIGSVAIAALVSDTGTYSVEVADKEHSSDLITLAPGGAKVEYIGSSANNESSGTGIFDPFVRLQADPTEAGYNTDGAVELDTKTGKWTHAIKVSAIPVVDCDGDDPGTATCWELFVDINDNNTAPHIALTDVEIYFADGPGAATLTGYPFSSPPSGTTVTQEYDFSGEIRINDVNQGSGRGDLRYLVPTAGHSFTPDTYFVLYSKWGSSTAVPDGGGETYASDGGFEEWKVRKTPNVSIVKTANPVGPVNAGDNIGFDITVSNTGVADATDVTISDALPTGAGSDLVWSLDPAFAGCSISGAAPQVLNCSFATLAAGGTIGPIHITSDTTAADCAVVSNTATVASGNDGGGSSTASVTVQCGALQITKTAKHAGSGSADLSGTFTVVDSAGASHTLEVTDGSGCVGGLAVGMTQSISEDAADFPGYAVPDIANVNVASGTCSNGTLGTGGTAVSVENVPLTDVDIVVDSQHDGATSTVINCWNGTSDPSTDPPDYTTTVSDGTLAIDDLEPTDPAITLNCEITIDP